ncbi:cell division protein FtsW [Mycetocola tolaasinivorans]|uniref:Probable peptidoglycan glycosyltransferase FtsW n=1 Tax=Mycetocola tolaasinivorans TaxID=76635 RepID=A0A3L6ZZR3_9MICO|nr:putative peptidoglycan glycosyltransferase FtsW [Mycetocola tolaasinivorans]RLP73200.1 cell division protein FtsW [Mycetocola tolaasinivorans]
MVRRASRFQARLLDLDISLRSRIAGISNRALLLTSVVLFLIGFGVVMVQSASRPGDAENAGDPFAGALRQGGVAALALIAMFLTSRASPKFWARFSWIGIAAALALQLAVYTPLGYESGGNRNWLHLGPVSVQPAEFMKFAFIIWAASVLGSKERLLQNWRHAIIPVVPLAALSMGINLIGGDLGTVLVMATVMIGVLVFANVRLGVIGIVAAAGIVAAILMTAVRANRVLRLLHFFQVDCRTDTADYLGMCWQPLHGTWALADGGIFGLGLGDSIEKWGWLPAADNDYLLAVVGEELGLVGTILVLVLFLILAVALLAILARARTTFGRVVAGGVFTWLITQAFINIAVVLGLLPVLGVPLPLMSTGGSALISAGAAIGAVLSVERQNARERGPRVPGTDLTEDQGTGPQETGDPARVAPGRTG